MPLLVAIAVASHTAGGPDPIALLSGIQRVTMMCKPCSEEYYRFLGEKWPGLGNLAITEEQIANIRNSDTAEVFREAEEHMKKWVADRNSK